MDILAHALWAGIAVPLVSRKRPVTPQIIGLTALLALWPDIAHAIPIFGWWLLGDGTWAALMQYAVATPDTEPVLPQSVQFLSHHLHCVGHSAVIAGVVTFVLWLYRRALWLPLIGWWLHIAIDVFTHSADYYVVPVFYPFSERGFDGWAWNNPLFVVLNYLTLSLTAVGLIWYRRRAANSPKRLAAKDCRGSK